MKVKTIAASFALFLSLVATAFCGVQNDVRSATVLLVDSGGWGSGFVFKRDCAGLEKTFIWTAAHVANHFVNSDGTFREVRVVQGESVAFAKVIRCGDHFVDTDCALLMVTHGDELSGDSHFYRAFNHMEIGQKVIHCGTPLSRSNSRLVFYGRLSAVDKMCEGYPLQEPRKMDHLDITAYGGCSGGPVVDATDGGIVGMVVLGSEPSLLIMEPARYIYEWAKLHDCLWAFDREIEVPENIMQWPSDYYIRCAKNRHDEADSRWGDPEEEKEPPAVDDSEKADETKEIEIEIV